MKSLITLGLALILALPSFSQEKRPIVSVDWLEENLERENLVLLHLSSPEEFEKEHIPGAVFISRSEYVVSSEDQSKVYDLPSIEELTELFQSKGINEDDTIVLYVGGNWVSPLTRIYFTLDYLGYANQTFILDGGLPLWKHEGGAISSGMNDEIEKGNFKPKATKDLVVDLDFVKENYEGNSFNIADARASVFYEGVQAAMGKKGHIPGAKTLPYTSMMSEGPNGSYQLLGNRELQTIFDEQGLDKNKPLVLYCHIGQQATLVYLSAKTLGYDVKLFDGSFHEWGSDDDNPIEID